jgi:hypothetical protein
MSAVALGFVILLLMPIAILIVKSWVRFNFMQDDVIEKEQFPEIIEVSDDDQFPEYIA